MKNSKKIMGLVLVLLTICMCVLFTGCKDATKVVTGITFKTGDAPRQTYVQGQSLDLTSGTLTVVKEDTTGNETVALSAPEVMVSGYDANKLGNQTITVSYSTFTTTFDVTVIPRMAVSGYKTNYMIGESLNKKGNVVVANDDGTTKTVSLSDSSIKLEGFDSSDLVDSLPITVTYTAGKTSYTTSFNVSIKPADKVEIRLPTNTIQYSHQDRLDLTGGQILVTFEGKQTAISIERNMVSGYEPSRATVDNMTTPLKQTVTISYAGVSKTYEVDVYFSGVSLFKLRASEFGELDYDEENGTIEPDPVFGPQAIEAMTEYFKLKASEKVLITNAEKQKVVRHAVVYARSELYKQISELSRTFYISDGNFIWMVNGSHADALKAYNVIMDDNSAFVTLGALLTQIKGEFADIEIITGATVGNNLSVAFDAEHLEAARKLLSYILELHDQMTEALPIDKTDWTIDDLNTAEATAAITSIVGKITNSGYGGFNFVPVYQMLSSWRAADDYFDIIWAYYYYGTDAQKAMIGQMFQVVPLPRLLQNVYAGIVDGYYTALTITQNPEEAIWYATENIFLAYREVMKAKEELEANGSDFCKELYEYLGMDTFIENNLIFDNERFQNGYFAQAKEMYGNDVFEDMWETYLSIYDCAQEDGQVHLDDPEVIAVIAEIYKKFVNLSPSMQYSFIASMHASYRDIDRYSRGGRLVLDYEDGQAQSNFVYIFANYFAQMFSYKDGVDENGQSIYKSYETATEIARRLFRAIELYALRNRLNTIRAFGGEMEEISLLYAEMTGEEKAKFDEILGFAYERYMALWEKTKSTETTTDWGEYADTVKEMQEALQVYFQMKANIDNPTLTAEQKAPFYPLLIAAYQKAEDCGAVLDAITDENLRYAYFWDTFKLSDDLTCSLEHGVWQARDTFITTMVNIAFTLTQDDGTQTVHRAWELYETSGLPAFMAQAYYIMAIQQNGGEFDTAKVLAAMEAYRAAEVFDISLFCAIAGDDLYFAGLKTFMGTLAADNKALGEKLLEVEQALYDYMVAHTEEKAEMLAAFRAAMEEAIALQSAVTSTDEYNEVLKEMYEYYLGIYNMIETPEA